MNDLSDEPGIGELAANPRQDPGPEGRRNRIRRVEPPGGGAPPQPMRQDGYGEIGDLVAVMVEHRQPLMPFEDGVPGAGSGRPGGAVGVVEVEETALAAAGDSGPEQRVAVPT